MVVAEAPVVAPVRAAAATLELAFWGVRGSVPTPGRETVQYGGNTTCLEVRGSDGGVAILDAGTGIRELGLSLLRQGKGSVATKIFITHDHLDHIHGFPFFTPGYVPGCTVDVYSGKKDLAERIGEGHTRQIFAGQMDVGRGYFPVGVDMMGGVTFHDVKPGQTVRHGSMEITALFHGAHPGGMFAYHIRDGGRTLLFAGDYEHDGKPGYQFGFWDRTLIAAAWGVDTLVVDTQYSPAEYASKKGWGHSQYKQMNELVAEAAVKRAYYTHHDPLHTDRALSAMEHCAQDHLREIVGCRTPLVFAREGMRVKL